MTFQIKKPGFYKQRNGKKCEVAGRLCGALWVGVDGYGDLASWDAYGRWSAEHTNRDIIAEWEEPQVIEQWLNVYEDGVGFSYDTEEAANKSVSGVRLELRRIKFTVGQPGCECEIVEGD